MNVIQKSNAMAAGRMTSLEIAQVTGKMHKDVMKAILKIDFKMARKEEVRLKLNKYRVPVKKCCMSCTFRDLTRSVGKRFCLKQEVDVQRDFYCPKWRMSYTQRMAGFARGSVKCREYLMFVLAVREDEALAIERGEEVEVKTIEALRAEFLEHHGEVYEQ